MPRRDLTNEQLLVDLDSNDPTVVLRAVGRTLPGLRSEVRVARMSWRFTAGVLVIAIVLGGWLIYRGNRATDDIIASRATARAGLCVAIDDMRGKHNHFVNTVITERQQLIEATDAGSGTPEQKATTRAFFQGQIDSYRTDLLDVIDCNNPDAIAALFTKPGG